VISSQGTPADHSQPRPSASVILVRDGPSGLETFMVRRDARSRAFASAYVFPGGTVREDDRTLAVAKAASLARQMNARSDTPLAPEEAAAYYVCAIRELFEEAGVLLARAPSGDVVRVDPTDTELQEHLESTRLALQAAQMTISDILKQGMWEPAYEWLMPFSHWITPRTVARRFDTRFFVARMPTGQSALHDTIETTEGLWLTPARALEPDYHTVYATAQHLERLQRFSTVQELLDFARSKTIRMVSPELAEDRRGLRAFIRAELVDAW
jgi:8-oxo-dGTP pyrophosphatase MutT (NUDIX family)